MFQKESVNVTKYMLKKIMIFQNNNPCIFCCAKFKYKENMSNCCAPIKNS